MQGNICSRRAVNQTEESLAVSCVAGHSGGMNQSFVLETWDEGFLQAASRSSTPNLKARRIIYNQELIKSTFFLFTKACRM